MTAVRYSQQGIQLRRWLLTTLLLAIALPGLEKNAHAPYFHTDCVHLGLRKSSRVFLTYTRFLKIKLRRNNIISAPIAPVRMAPTQPEPRLTPSFPKDQLPTKLPITPTMIFPISPRLLPLNIELPSHPAIAPLLDRPCVPGDF